MDKERILQHLGKDFEEAKNSIAVLKNDRINWYREYKADLYGNEVEGRSKIVSSDIMNVVEWMLPNLIEPFVLGDPVKLIPVGVEDERNARLLEQLLKMQLKRQNDWYFLNYDILKSGLIYGTGVFKIHWEGYPRIECVPPEQILIEPNAKDFYESRFVIHTMEITLSELRELKKNGLVDFEDEFEKFLVGYKEGNDLETQARFEDLGGMYNYEAEDEARKKIEVVEYWGEYDLDGDGIVEPIVAMWVQSGNKKALLRIEENPYPDKKPPFVFFQGIREPFKAWGWSISKLLSDLQKLKTAIWRDIIDNLARQNNAMYEIDELKLSELGRRVLKEGKAGSVIPTRGGDAIRPIAPAPIATQVFKAWDMADMSIQNRSGVTKYTQGLDSKSLNRTATGISAIMNASFKRIWELAMRYAEGTLKPLIRKLIAWNQKMLDKSIMIRLSEGDMFTVDKNDISGIYDIEIEVAMKQANEVQAANLIALLQYTAPYIQAGVIDPRIIEEIFDKIFKLWGFKGLSKYLKGGRGGGYNQAGTGTGEFGAMGGVATQQVIPETNTTNLLQGGVAPVSGGLGI